MALGSTQALTEMSTRNLYGCKRRPARKADKLTAICEPIVETKCGNLEVSQLYGLSWPIIVIALPSSLAFIHKTKFYYHSLIWELLE
jgi:hypothetical protein